MRNHNLKFLAALIVFFVEITTIASAQSIRINIDEYTSYCAGTKIQIPVTINGIWTGSTFVAKFHSSYPDTTFYLNAENTTSPLQFTIPKMYSGGSYYCTLTINSTLPEIYSSSVRVILKTLATVQLGDPIQYYEYSSGDGLSSKPKNEYVDAGELRQFTVNMSGMVDDADGFILNDSTKYYRNSQFYLSTNTNKTYFIARAWNACGAAKIILHEMTLKVNPFSCKITDIYPNTLCDSRELNVMFDYKGTYNNDNHFNLEIANLQGDTVRTVPTTEVDAKTLKTVLDNSFLPGYYFVRIKSSSPEGASPYKVFRIYPKAFIDMNWYVGNAPTVEYKQVVTCRLTVNNVIRQYSEEYADVRLSNGLLVRYSSVYADFTIYPEKSGYYTIDSLIAPCGVIKNFDVRGSTYITVMDGFSIKGQNKTYCVNEKVKLKISSPINFNSGNQFTAKIYQGTVLKGTFPASIENDSLVFTLSSTNGFDPNFGNSQIRVESSSPNLTSSPSDGFFQMHKTPKLKISTNYATLSVPGYVSILGEYQSQIPAVIVINDGQRDSTVVVYSGSNEYFSSGFSTNTPMFAKVNTVFRIKSISNSCGIGLIELPYDNISVTVNNPQTPKVSLINTNSRKAICMGVPTPIYFNFGGNFNANNEFIIYLYDGNNPKTEIGRGTSSPIMVTIPLNAYTRSSPFINIESTSPVTNTNIYSDEQSLTFQIKNAQISFSNSWIDSPYYLYGLQFTAKNLEMIRGSKLKQGFNEYSDTYIDLKTKFKVNNQWFDSEFSLNPTTDTTLYLQGYINACGYNESPDTISIKMKKYRLNYSVLGGKFRCMNGTIDIVLNIEGNHGELSNNFDFKFVPNLNKNMAYNADIISITNGVYHLKIPDMPYEGFYTLKIISATNAKDFIQTNFGNELVLYKNPIVKLTAEDGSDIVWTSYGSSNPKIKIETLNSNNPSLTLKLSNDDSYNIYNKIEIKSLYYNNISPIEIASINATCGFGQFIGKVSLKRCENSLALSYYDYAKTDYISNGSIQAGNFYGYGYWLTYFVIPNTKKVLFSAKTKIELFPGFSAENGSVFQAEIKGCPNTN